MANTTKITTVAEGSVLDKLLHSGLPHDTDGLPGLVDAPVVYDLILRDLHEDIVLMSSQETAEPEENRDGVASNEHRPEA
ncbi:MAG: hypothetical protein ACYTGW_07495 [Planctomycetota bacterium]|jgi:hypothetical protein